MNGIVKFYKKENGYGFITEAGTNKEVFFHVTGSKEELKKGDLVSFDTKDGNKGVVAVNIVKATLIYGATSNEPVAITWPKN